MAKAGRPVVRPVGSEPKESLQRLARAHSALDRDVCVDQHFARLLVFPRTWRQHGSWSAGRVRGQGADWRWVGSEADLTTELAARARPQNAHAHHECFQNPTEKPTSGGGAGFWREEHNLGTTGPILTQDGSLNAP